MGKHKTLVIFLSLLALFFAFLMIGFNLFHTPKFAKDSISLDEGAVAVMAESNLYEGPEPSQSNDYSDEYDQKESLTDSTGQGYYNLNTVTFDQLVSLPEIGEVKAEAILQLREDLGGFTSVEQLMDVSGIGEATYETISPYFYIE